MTMCEFQSTRPHRGAPPSPAEPLDPAGFQSTRPHRGATPKPQLEGGTYMFQSTRPHRGATSPLIFGGAMTRFQSTCPHRGATFALFTQTTGGVWFQSTRPHRGATRLFRSPRMAYGCFNPRARIGARPGSQDSPSPPSGFNPRARIGARQAEWAPTGQQEPFQSTRPHRGATCGFVS